MGMQRLPSLQPKSLSADSDRVGLGLSLDAGIDTVSQEPIGMA